VKKNDPTTYPKWLLGKLKQMEDEKAKCCKVGQVYKSRLDSLRPITKILREMDWGRQVVDVPGGFDIIVSFRWKK
jgi:hypothetical protein